MSLKDYLNLSEVNNLKISFFIMIVFALAILILELFNIIIFQKEFAILIIYIPTIILGLSWFILQINLKKSFKA